MIHRNTSVSIPLIGCHRSLSCLLRFLVLTHCLSDESGHSLRTRSGERSTAGGFWHQFATRRRS